MASFKSLIYSVMKNKQRPMHYKEITEEVNIIKPYKGKTPLKTTLGILSREKNSFVRINKGVYRLRNSRDKEN